MSEPVIPILLDIPESIETERLLIRAAQWGDGAEMNAAIMESLNELQPWMIFAQKPQPPEESEIFVREARINYLKRTNMHMGIYNKTDGTFVGCSGLHHIDWGIRSFELGYWIRTSCSGKGYMTEAVNAITNFAIQELEANRIEIRCSGRNAKSAAVAERAGYKLDGVLRLSMRGFDGELHDSKVYAKVRGSEF
ncbi:GNAT family N-acetyltransferase [Paenibacillus typhae]|uniref:Protein N-acetyltransferase, RimJ/RimL family n=1 Tax=Paenibacillus typhae TaxID=1174501 RepID=A0A1G9EP24_9BACL|nr:GNAT family N-acetyltransferase [Paenibacillus typhae]SDK77823.1 Protein N-acetyltransferase, RimJ/RimL family [Paenibacillus typhae]